MSVLDGNKVVKKRLRETRADQGAESFQPDDKVWLLGIVRLDLSEIEREAETKWKTISMPYELVVLDILK